MKSTILDIFKEGPATCYLCRMSLEEYIANLPPSFQDYEIQREIVVNAYLDQLVTTVLEKRHIPPIVLIADDFKVAQKELVVSEFKILDGLQRTYRLKAIRDTIQIVAGISSLNDAIQWTKFKLSRDFSKRLNDLNSNTQILSALIRNQTTTSECFSSNVQWFEIWTDLSSDDAIRKMLVLNAGHKPVKPKHQLELLFLNLLPKIKVDIKGFEIVREKEHSSITFSKQRQSGQFHFAHVIAALLSFVDGQPVTTNAALLQDIQSSDSTMDSYIEVFTAKFMRAFAKCLVTVDKQLQNQYGELGVKWLGREVSLSALFGAVGAIGKSKKLDSTGSIDFFERFIVAHAKALNLQEYEDERNGMDLSKVNFGRVNKDAIFNATKIILEADHPTAVQWNQYLPQG